VEFFEQYFPLIVALSGPAVDVAEVRQMSEGYEKYFERGERYAVLNLTQRDFVLPDGAGRKLIADWVHHPRVRDYTRRLCVGAVSVNRGLLYRVAFNLVMTFDKPVVETKCVATLEEGLDHCLGRIRAEGLKLAQSPDFVRYEVLERFRKLI
jgi:hypothetical protein